MLSIHITIDDLGENINQVESNHSILNTLFVKGRRYQISTALLLQRVRLGSPTIRYNAHALYVHKLSNMAGRKALSEDFGELLGDESIFTELLHRATAEYVTLGSEPKFFSRYRSEFNLNNAASQGKENVPS